MKKGIILVPLLVGLIICESFGGDPVESFPYEDYTSGTPMKQFEKDLKKAKYEYNIVKLGMALGIVYTDKLDVALGDPPCRVLLLFTPISKLYYGSILRWTNFESMGKHFHKIMKNKFGNPKREKFIDYQSGIELDGYKWETKNAIMFLFYDKNITFFSTVNSDLMVKANKESRGK